FIFATTEIRKVPITVLSRCQRFDLRRVDAHALTGHLARIAGLEDVAVEDEALAMIARAAEGSVRDSLSILDQAIAHGGGAVSAEAVRAMLGLADRARVIDLFEHVMRGDLPEALAELRRQYDAGADPVVVLTDMAEFNHLVTRLKFVPDAADDASLSQDERTRGLDFAGRLSVRVLSRSWQMLLKGIEEVRSASRPVSAAEMVLIRMAHAADLPTLDEAIRRVEEGAPQGVSPGNGTPRGNGNGASASGTSAAPVSAVSQQAPAAVQGSGTTMRLVRNDPVAEAPPRAGHAEAEPAAAPDAVPVRSLEDIAALADKHRDMPFKVTMKRCMRLVSIEPGHLSVSLTPDAPPSLPADAMRRLTDWTGRRWMVSLSREEGGATLSEVEDEQRETMFADARSDPAVAAILQRFPGSRVVDVRLPETVPELPGDEGMPVAAIEEDDDEL
ncbi:MAG: DNA polymerase III subunit gamma/tau, partial [Notoacmeibacter sp.]|nr:DNA polymerase III subunit gamma/tau [Notoacmeibacter sp.]